MALISYTSLEPSYFQATGVQTPGFNTGQAVSLFSSTSFLYSLAIMISVLAAGVMYARAGVYRMQASEVGVRKSNDEIKRVTLGLLGVLSLFVILYTFNKDLLSGNVGLDGLRAAAGKSGGFVSGGGGNFGGGGATAEIPSSTTNGTEQANRSALSAQGITVNKSACTAAQMTESKPSCSNLADLPQSVMSMLVQLKDSCPGSTLVVTGGTEPGHKSHGPGKAAVDLRIGDAKLDSCISKFPSGPPLNYCTATYSGLGFLFCNEKGTNHWHVFK